jgi:hypothetical protein
MALVAAFLWLRAACDGGAAREPTRTPAPTRGAGRLLYAEKLDPNREPAEVLALLPGIGPARAAAIVAARPICSLADLDRLPGIGPATLRALEGRLAFDDCSVNCEHELRAEGIEAALGDRLRCTPTRSPADRSSLR